MDTPSEFTSRSQARRVFILGAGFSKPAGFPLATELTDEVLEEIRKLTGDDYELFAFAANVRQLHRWITRERSMPLLNIEEFYEYASIYAERFRFEQHLEEVGRDAGDTSYGEAQNIETWLSVVDDYLLDVLLRHEQDANLEPIQRFVNTLRPRDTIITFNYDRLVERALGAKGTPWALGFSGASDEAVSVLKVHGSADWICFARDQRPSAPHIRRLFSKRDVNRERGDAAVRSGELEYDFELYQVADDDKLRRLVDGRALIQHDHFWGVAGLGPKKRVSSVPGLGMVWDQARRALFNADQVVIVGFSFSGYDRLAQIEFARVMAGRDEKERPRPRILVIDPLLRKNNGRMGPPGRALIRRIETVFRPAQCCGAHHEQVDWQIVG